MIKSKPFMNWKATVGFIFLLAIFTMGANPFTETIAPVDLLANSRGWANVISEIPDIENEARSDVIDVMIPNSRTMQRNRDSSGYFAFYFLRGNWTKILFLPHKLPVHLFEMDTAIYLECLIKLMVSGWGMFLFLQLFINKWHARLFGAISFMLCGFQVSWIFWSQSAVAMWFPWMLWVTYKIFESKRPFPYIILLSLLSAFSIYAWFPSVAAYCFYALGLWVVMLLLFMPSFRDRNRIIAVIAALVISFVLASPLILNQKAILFDTFNVMADRVKYGGTKLASEHLQYLINPNYSGEPFPEFNFFTGRLLIFILLFGLFFRAVQMFRSKHTRILLVFSVAIVIIAFVIGWGLIDRDLIRLIPTFSNNPWHRITILLSFGLACLAAIILNTFEIDHLKRMNQVGMMTLLLFICGVQWWDLRTNYHEMNGVWQKELFYPTTPTIEFMQKTINPSQKVMADNSFFVPGTLRYYGLEDWFSHGWKSSLFREYLDKLAKDSNATPTASSYTIDDVAPLNSPFYDIMNIKYITSGYTEDLVQHYPPLWNGESVPVNLLNAKSASVNFDLDQDVEVVSIAAVLGTYERSILLDQPFKLVVNSERWDTTYHFRDSIVNNETHHFTLSQALSLRGGEKYTLSIVYEGRDNVAIWAKDSQTPKLALNRRLKVEALGWKKLNQEPGVLLLSNESISNGVYWVDSIHLVDSELAYDGAMIRRVNPSTYEISVQDIPTNSQWLVAPLNESPFWVMDDPDGVVVEQFKYMGIFPAYKIAKTGSFSIKNRIPYVGVANLVVFFLILGMIWLYSKREYLNQRYFASEVI